MSAREAILARVRSQLPAAGEREVDYARVPRGYRVGGTLDEHARMDLLKDRLLDYDATVVEVAEDGIAAAVKEALHAAGEERLLVPVGMNGVWLPAGVEAILYDGAPVAEVNRAQAVLTACEVAIAETGTIVLVHRGAQGRRVDTLLPDHHICVVRRALVVETVPEGWRALAGMEREAITTISGPSATSDIEMTRIRGVHGPRRLSVVLVA